MKHVYKVTNGNMTVTNSRNWNRWQNPNGRKHGSSRLGSSTFQVEFSRVKKFQRNFSYFRIPGYPIRIHTPDSPPEKRAKITKPLQFILVYLSTGVTHNTRK